MLPVNIWEEIRSRIRSKVNRLSYERWFMPTAFVADEGGKVTVSVPTPLFRDWILKHYSSLIAEAIEEVHRSDAVISFIVAEPPDIGFHSIDERFNRVDHELAAIRRDVDLILSRLSGT